MRGLYIHIPFCRRICNYCDFPKRIPTNSLQIEEYINYLINELDSYKDYYSSVSTIYIGGGTPNLLNDILLEKLLRHIDSYNINHKEYTIECNPEFITSTQLQILKKYKVNRISLGVETFNNDDLKLLNRGHTKEEVLDKIKLIKKYFDNINIDLIYAHPFDTLDKVKENLNIFYKLDIPHISYYSMILEEKTVFNHLINNNKLKLLDNDTEGQMYEYIINDLKKHNFHHYETSNFSKNGYESIHNTIYWDAKEYIGVGLGASGYLNNIRYTNSNKIQDYYMNVKIEEIYISNLDKKKEFFLLGLRKIDGVSLLIYKELFNSDPYKDFDLDKLLKEELIIIQNDILKLSSKGIMLANEVFMEFV